jgi:hypothetical protein
MRELLETLGARSRQTRRYRSAWLSARRRAVDEFNHGAEALALRGEEIARLKAEQRTIFGMQSGDCPQHDYTHDATNPWPCWCPPLRQSIGGAPVPELECAGTEEDGSTVWRLRTPK